MQNYNRLNKNCIDDFESSSNSSEILNENESDIYNLSQNKDKIN